jgi:hypothetical protein
MRERTDARVVINTTRRYFGINALRIKLAMRQLCCSPTLERSKVVTVGEVKLSTPGMSYGRWRPVRDGERDAAQRANCVLALLPSSRVILRRIAPKAAHPCRNNLATGWSPSGARHFKIHHPNPDEPSPALTAEVALDFYTRPSGYGAEPTPERRADDASERQVVAADSTGRSATAASGTSRP